MGGRRSLWMFGLESEEPSYEQRVEAAAAMSERLGVELMVPHIPGADALELRRPRIAPPDRLGGFCRQDNWDRARPWYDVERPEPFAAALTAAKKALDPNGVLNPGVLVDPIE